MSRLIRNYEAGDHIVLSDWLRAQGTRERQDSPEEIQQRALAQVHHEAEQMRQQAAQLLAQAEAQAMEIREEATNEINTLQAEAQARGYEDGYKQGIADAQQKAHTTFAHGVEQMQQVLAELSDQRRAILANAETEVATLSMAIVEKIVGQIAHTYQPLILYTVNRALAKIAADETIIVHLHPEDHQVLADFWQNPAPNVRPPAAWQLVIDPQIDRGGCLLFCGSTTVDARLATQLQNLVDGLQIPDYLLGSVAEEKPSPLK